ncbi:MAG: hypothetical protein H6747_12610 [Deltaproteobacteria bacterium]|nr:hypothetical protein [Deltaproteobacteria bacterium]
MDELKKGDGNEVDGTSAAESAQSEADAAYQRDMMLLGAVGYEPDESGNLPPGWKLVDETSPLEEIDPLWKRLSPERQAEFEFGVILNWLRGLSVLLAAVSVIGGIAAFPSIAGRLFAADGTISDAIRLTLAQMLSFALFATALVLLFCGLYRPAMNWIFRYRKRVLLSLLLITALAAGAAYQAFSAAEVVAWQQAVARQSPEMAEVARSLDAGDEAAAWTALVEKFRQHQPAGAPFSERVVEITEAEAEFAAGRLQRDRLPLRNERSVAWPAGEPVPWGKVKGSARYTLGRGEPLVAALAGAESTRKVVLQRVRAFFLDWQRNRWEHRRWPGAEGAIWAAEPTVSRTLALLDVLAESRRAGPLAVEEAGPLLRLLLLHREVLLDRRSQVARGKRAMAVDTVMLALSTAYPFLDPERAMGRASRERMVAHRTAAFAESGPLIEHSLIENCQFALWALWHAALRDRVGERLAEGEAAHLEVIVGFLREMRNPDGTMPPIGAASESGMCPALDRFVGFGLDGSGPNAKIAGLGPSPAATPAPGRAKRWMPAGYALLDTGDSPGLPRLFTTMTVARSYGDDDYRDALALTLFGGGRQLLRGPGWVSQDDPRGKAKLSAGQHSSAHITSVSGSGAGGTIVHVAASATETALDSGVVAAQHEATDRIRQTRAVFYGPVPGVLLVLDRVRSEQAVYLSIHERLVDAPAVSTGRGSLLASWPGSNPTTLMVERFARLDGSTAASLPVHWRSPMAWSEVRGAFVDVATFLVVGRQGPGVAAEEANAEDVTGGFGNIDWTDAGIRWSGPRGSWQIPLQPDKVQEATYSRAVAQ